MHRDYLRRVIDLRLDQGLRGRVDVSDIIQETNIVVAKRIDEFLRRRPTSFKLWLRGEAIQQVKIQRRRHQVARRRTIDRECRLSDVSSMQMADKLKRHAPGQIAERREQARQIRRTIDAMPEHDREVLLLRYVEELTNAEVAELLAIEPDCARKRHGRALHRLLALMVASGLVEAPEKK